jgi:hypothetical protein
MKKSESEAKVTNNSFTIQPLIMKVVIVLISFVVVAAQQKISAQYSDLLSQEQNNQKLFYYGNQQQQQQPQQQRHTVETHPQQPKLRPQYPKGSGEKLTSSEEAELAAELEEEQKPDRLQQLMVESKFECGGKKVRWFNYGEL